MAPLPENAPLDELDRASVLHPATPLGAHQDRTGGLIVDRAKGVAITDVHGKRYLDGGAGLWCVNVGYGREELGRAAAEEMSRLGYYHTFAGVSNRPSIELADRLLARLRESGSFESAARVFFGLSGSDANDTQVKLVRYYNNLRGRPEKKKIIARHGSYHGLTLASASLTGIPVFHRAYDLPIDGVSHVTTPHYYREGREGESEEAFSARLADELEAKILAEGPETVAAFIAEPVMGAGGVYLPPRGYFERIQTVLERHEVLFIADEVICGFGRLGSWFGSGRYGIRPDLMTCAKGITSGYFPLSAVIVSEEIWSTLRDAPDDGMFAHGFTYSGHPVGAAVANANLDIFESEGLVERAAEVGAYLQERLHSALDDHPRVGEVRGVGLIAAVELVEDRNTRAPFDPALAVHKQVSAAAQEAGLLARALPGCQAIAFSPPLTIREGEVDQMVDVFAKALRATIDDL